jgi:putative ABC transport system ATP-binding protein
MGEKVFHALKNINLTINKGEYIAILGQSGSGKSTLMSLLGCLDEPSSGEYLFLNQKISTLNKDQLADIRNHKIGFIFQSFHLLPHITALDNVGLPLLFRGISMKKRRDKAHELLKKLGLSSHAHHLPAQLSGGQQQRIAIARALITDPELILADEPTGNLDTQSSEDVMALFEKFLEKDSTKTLIMVTHNLEIAKRASRVITMKDGEIV